MGSLFPVESQVSCAISSSRPLPTPLPTLLSTEKYRGLVLEAATGQGLKAGGHNVRARAQ